MQAYHQAIRRPALSTVAASCLAVVLAAAPVSAAFAQTAPVKGSLSKPARAYKAPRNALGQPDLGENWTNASLTPEQRPVKLGQRSAYTPDEVKKLEQAVVDEVEVGNRPTAADAPINVDNGLQSRPEFAAAGGSVGGYNRGWLDPGSAVMRVHGEARTSLLTTPDGRVPARKAGAVRLPGVRAAGGAFDNPENRSLGERCIIGFGRNGGPPMLANGFYNNNYRFVQSKDMIAIEVEMAHDIRFIRLGAKEHLPSNIRPYFGDSIGHWEGDTLVVETTNIPQSQEYNGSWEHLKVTERFTRLAKDRLYYQYSIDDPTQWDKPWGGEYEFSPLNGMLMEYACHEGNYALEGILAGARQTEPASPQAAASTGAAAR
jgi:hypothetical protein